MTTTTTATAAPEQRLGPFTLLDRIAADGAAQVWRAVLSSSAAAPSELYAVKRWSANIVGDEPLASTFIDEARITRALRHDNIVRVFDVDRDDDWVFATLEYVSGPSVDVVWRRCVEQGRTMPFALAALVARGVAAALHSAHTLVDNHGAPMWFVHRNLTPENVLLSWDGAVKVGDFGSLRVFANHAPNMRRKLMYMSPEVIRGHIVDGRSDLFSLGVILYELCTGRHAFAGSTEFSMLENVAHARIAPPTSLNPALPPALDAILRRLLAPARDDRYQTAADLLAALDAFLADPAPPWPARDLAGWLRSELAAEFDLERARLDRYGLSSSSAASSSSSSASTASSSAAASTASSLQSHLDGELARVFGSGASGRRR